MRHVGIVASVLDDAGTGPAVALLGEGEREIRGLAARQADRNRIGKITGQKGPEGGTRSRRGAGPRRPAAA